MDKVFDGHPQVRGNSVLEIKKQIQAAINSQDQLVFMYTKDDGTVVTRYATPLSMEDKNMPSIPPGQQTVTVGLTYQPDFNVLCLQHLPKTGYRSFKLDKMSGIFRTITRAIPTPP